MLAGESSVGLRDQIDMVLDHLKTDHGMGGRIDDGLASREARRRTFRIFLETKIGAGIDLLHDYRAIVETDHQNGVTSRG